MAEHAALAVVLPTNQSVKALRFLLAALGMCSSVGWACQLLATSTTDPILRLARLLQTTRLGCNHEGSNTVSHASPLPAGSSSKH
jgi:hypothetical protein